MTFSAGSVFTLCMRELPDVTIVGDTTGGGLGLPIGTELANGWQLRFSGTQILSAGSKCYEMGVPPDVTIQMDATDEQNGIDSIIEKAVEIITNE
jgi:C-terminal processing protease CtpA/Prc